MRKLITILLIVTCLSVQAQYQDRSEAYKALAIIGTSIILDAVGDGFNDSGSKVLGHSLNAASVGILVASPFILKIPRHKWGWYAATYVTMRIAIFDPLYNITRGLPIGYVGDSSLWDKSLQKQDPNWLLAGRGLCLVVSISIPLKQF